MPRTRPRKNTGTGNSAKNAKKREEKAAHLFKSKYDRRFCQVVIDCGIEGLSETQMALECGVARGTIRLWAKEHKEFGEALAIAKDQAMAWWEDKGQSCLIMDRGKTFQTRVWEKTMASRFRADYSERVTVEGDKENPIVHTIRRVIVKAGEHAP